MKRAHAGCYNLIVFLCLVTVGVLWLLLSVPLVGLQCVIVHFFLLYSFTYSLADWFKFNIGLQLSNGYDLMSTSLHTQFKRVLRGSKNGFVSRLESPGP